MILTSTKQMALLLCSLLFCSSGWHSTVSAETGVQLKSMLVANLNEDGTTNGDVTTFDETFQQTVTGTVTDSESGETMPGVNVAVDGTTTGTATNIDGEYTVEVSGPDAVLIFSFVGYETQRISVGDQDVISVELIQDFGRLDEVIVVGYGTVKRSDLTGSVQRVTAEDFRSQSMTQLTEMLSGTVPGLYSQQGTSASGGSSMEIRGPSSLTAGTSPMVVLDGVVYNGSINDINPNDIETIDILKDASSAAIYGANAASGVILITTSRGDIGAPRINYSTKLGVSQVTKHRRPLNAEQFLQFRGDYFTEVTRGDESIHENFYTNPDNLPSDLSVDEWRNLNDSPNADPFSEYLQRLNLYNLEQQNALAGNSVDWYPMAITEGLRQSHDLSISGGTDNSRYYWSIGYVDNEGVIRGDQHTAIRSRLNVDFTITDWLSVGANTQLSERDESVVQANLGAMYIASPYGSEYNEDGSIRTMRVHEDPSVHHPLMDYYGRDRERKVNTLFSSIYADLNLPFGVEYRMSFQPRYTYTNEQNFWGAQTITGSQTYDNGYATRASGRSFEWMLDNLFSWNREIGIHQFDVTLLLGAEKSRSWQENQSNSNFTPNPNLGFHALQYGDNPSLSNNDSVVTGDAAMARINYTLLDKYLFTASVRRDGYSAFGQEEPRAVFPAAAFAWQISEEDFFNVDWMNQLKMRLSWGVNGNRDIGAFSALAVLQSHLDYDGSNVHVGVENATLANPGLVWEKTEAFNVGLDFGLLENRIDGTLDFYVGTTSDLLMNRQLPQMTGFSSVTTNLGELENRGFEMTLRSVNVNTSDFVWGSDVVFSLNRNKIVSLFGDMGEYRLMGETHTGEVPDFTNRWFPGQAVDVVWGYDVTGIWQEEEAAAAAEYGLEPGDFKAVDMNQSGSYEELEDKIFLGHTDPRYRLGVRNNFTYRNFSASIFIRADLGHLTPFNEALTFSFSHDRRNYQWGDMPYWTAENRNNEFARLRPNHSPFGGGLDIYKSASFLRIQDLSVSYALPSDLVNRFQLHNLSVFGSVRNLYTFDRDFPGWDPESRMSPMPRTITLGLELSL